MNGTEIIAQERLNQLGKHGHTHEHDDSYINNELVDAAMQYLGGGDIDCWPENWTPMKECDSRIEELSKAGALVAAEIDRLLRSQDKWSKKMAYGSSIPPSQPQVGDKWVDYNHPDLVTKVWDGVQWGIVGEE